MPISPLDAALLLAVGLCVLAGVLRGLVRAVLIVAVLLLLVVFSPLGNSSLWQDSKAAALLSQLLAHWHSQPMRESVETFVRDRTEQARLGRKAAKRDNAGVEQTPQQQSPGEGVRWPQPLEEPVPAIKPKK